MLQEVFPVGLRHRRLHVRRSQWWWWWWWWQRCVKEASGVVEPHHLTLRVHAAHRHSTDDTVHTHSLTHALSHTHTHTSTRSQVADSHGGRSVRSVPDS